MCIAEFRGPGVHHRIDDSPDDIDMDLDHRFRPNSGGRIILLGDGSEVTNEAPDSDMFDHDDEDKDLESQVNKFNKDDSASNSKDSKEAITEPQPTPARVTESPSSVQTEKSETPEQVLQATATNKQPGASPAQTSEK